MIQYIYRSVTGSKISTSSIRMKRSIVSGGFTSNNGQIGLTNNQWDKDPPIDWSFTL